MHGTFWFLSLWTCRFIVLSFLSYLVTTSLTDDTYEHLNIHITQSSLWGINRELRWNWCKYSAFISSCGTDYFHFIWLRIRAYFEFKWTATKVEINNKITSPWVAGWELQNYTNTNLFGIGTPLYIILAVSTEPSVLATYTTSYVPSPLSYTSGFVSKGPGKYSKCIRQMCACSDYPIPIKSHVRELFTYLCPCAETRLTELYLH